MADEIEIIVTSVDETEAGFASARTGADSMAGDVEGSMARVGSSAEEAGVAAERFGEDVEGAGRASGDAADFLERVAAGQAEYMRAASEAAMTAEEFTGAVEEAGRGAEEAARAVEEVGMGAEEAGRGLEEVGMAAEEAAQGAEEAGQSFNFLGEAASGSGGRMSPMMMILAAIIAILPALSAAAFSAGAALLDTGAAAAVALIGLGGLKQAVDQFLPSLGVLKGAVSQVFAADLDGPMTKFGQSILQLEPILKTIAGSESDVIKGVMDWIQSSAGMATVQRAWAGVNDMVVHSKEGFVALTQVFTQFAADAAPSMAKISDAISGFFERWQQGVQKLQDSGDLTKVFQAGAQAITAFGNVMGGLLDVFAQLAVKAGPASADALNKIASALSAAAPAIGDFAKGIALAINAFATFALIVSDLLKALGPFGDVLSTVAGFAVATAVGVKLAAVAFGLLADGIKLVSGAIAFLVANPEIAAFIIAAAAIAAIAALIIQNWGPISDFFGDLFNKIGDAMSQWVDSWGDAWNRATEGLKTAANSIIDFLNAIIKVINSVSEAVGSMFGNSPGSSSMAEIPHFATGGVSMGGLAMVGEHGPELVNLPGGSSVSSASDTDAMLGGGGGSGGGALQLSVAGGTDQAVATMFMQLIRSGRMQIRHQGVH